ncbi:ABC transporter permease subunit [Guptibacillus algicola]|uniref:ABC transporter permease subunit n=1 Tax=Guptibacillus algicola TaxID=225844 RepID=UPI001CD668EE|nr:ABC transporter permease subunit [Alkalihalobacillus algicola]MCA0987155.1 ABC transporter permease subunit [Alkalihalobacillus algicola]
MKTGMKFISIILSILLIGSFAGMFQNGIEMSLKEFWNQFIHLIGAIANLRELTYEPLFGSTTVYPVFPAIFEYYGYSLFILVAGFGLALIGSLGLTYITFLLPYRLRKMFIKVTGILEAIPDLFIIVVFQIAIVSLYKETGLLIFEVVGGFERPIVLPLITYAVLPAILLYRIMLLTFEDELVTPYVELARGKGLSTRRILLKHVLRNALFTVVNHSRTIIVLMLSNLVMLEILFNLYGLTWFMVNNISVEIVVIGILMIFVPLFLIEACSRFFIQRITGKELAE